MTARTHPVEPDATTRVGAWARSAVATGRHAAVEAGRLLRHGDLAIVYAVVLVGVTTVLSVLGSHTYDTVVANSSTNLANLREQPWAVLLASAFVVSSPWGLWLLPFLMLLYAAAQRWVGRLGTVVVAAVGHVGATLVVATGLSAGIAHGTLRRATVLHAIDVGVSYGMVCVAAFLIARVPRRWRAVYTVVVVAYVAVPFALEPSFTGAGHSISFVLGALLAVLAHRVERAVRRSG